MTKEDALRQEILRIVGSLERVAQIDRELKGEPAGAERRRPLSVRPDKKGEPT
jgi:hypothetical protein